VVRVYGAFKPTISAASGATESFSNPNLVAITAAGNPVYAVEPDHARSSFQAQQSRLGAWFGEGTPYRGQLEFDFVDATRASPTVASIPRLRIAKLEWAASEDVTLVAGQDWGLEQPINPHGINLVGGGFLAGNTAFMRQQVKVLAKVGDLEVGAAVGVQSNNNTAKDGLVELSVTPTVAGRVQWNPGGKSRVGVSVIGTSLLVRSGDMPLRTIAGEAGVYGDVDLTPAWNLRFEGYVAQNAANLFLLALGQARAGAAVDDPAVDLREVGGFVSTRVAVRGPWSVFANAGGAAVLNDEDVVPSYGYAGTIDPANPPPMTAAALAGTGPGIRLNLHARLGVEVKVRAGLSFLAEAFGYRTRHALLEVDEARTSATASTVGAELGGLWTF
jgi:hypothetical protein